MAGLFFCVWKKKRDSLWKRKPGPTEWVSKGLLT